MDIRKQFTAKYGKDFVSSAIELRPDCGVGRMVSFQTVCVIIIGWLKLLMVVYNLSKINGSWCYCFFLSSMLLLIHNVVLFSWLRNYQPKHLMARPR